MNRTDIPEYDIIRDEAGRLVSRTLRATAPSNGHRFPCANYIRPAADLPCTNPNGCTVAN